MKKFFLSFIFFFPNACPLTIGSDTTPSRQASVIFPTATDNQILGFAAMDFGFTLADAATTVTYNAFLSSSGMINFNGGTFFLANDFKINTDGFIVNTGSVIGNQNAVMFSKNITGTTFPVVPQTNALNIYDLNTFFPNAATMVAPLNVNGSCMMVGTGNTFILDKNKPIIVQPNSELLVENFSIIGMGGNALSCADDTSIVRLKNVKIYLDHIYNFSHGSLIFEGDVVMQGTNTFIYSSPMTSTLNVNSTLFCDFGTSVSFAQNTSYRKPLYMYDQSSILYLNGCSLFVSRTGLEISRGTVCFDNTVTISCEGKNALGALTIKYDVNTHVQSRASVDIFGNIIVG